ncbi:heat shock transcription factor, X-linked member 3-like [Saccopteryx bilineata]|uniref:heat shock transcription factor, X-linked member 3-like n=1 Tax=Saccopteryx bilineata TaxID=59482 RepID=UPI0033903A27
MDEDKQHLSGREEPSRGLPSVEHLDASMYPKMLFRGRGDPNGRGSAGVRPRDNPQPKMPTRGSGEMGRKKYLRRHSFPRKLWKIVEDNTFTSVRWSDNGDLVIIDQDLFQREVLRRKGAQTGLSWLTSFTQRLSLYGFKKITPTEASGYLPKNNRILMYRNSNFRKDKPWLMQNMTRQDNQMTPVSAGTPERGEPAAPRILHVDATEAANQKAQESIPDAQGSSAMGSFQLAGLGSPSHASGVHVPTELSGPRGEVTYGNSVPVPTCTVETNSTGEGPSSAPDYTVPGSLMFYHYIYQPIILAAFPVVVIAPEGPVQLTDQEE